MREEMQSNRHKLQTAESELGTLRSEVKALRNDCTHWKQVASRPRQRTIELPSELSMGSPDDYAALMEQLVDCLAELKAKDLAVEEGKAALERYKVVHT